MVQFQGSKGDVVGFVGECHREEHETGPLLDSERKENKSAGGSVEIP
jgi:hypothetical protein